MIDDLVDRIRKTPVADKDTEAERHLQQTLGTVPDALYILAQTVLVQQYGLTQAQAQREALQNELEQLRREGNNAPTTAPPKGGSFLSRIFGNDEPTSSQTPSGGQGYAPPAQQGPAAGSGGYQPVNYTPAPQGYPPPPYGAPAYGGPAYGGPAYGSPAPPPGYGQAYGQGYGQSYGQSYGNPGMFGGAGGGGGFLRGALQTATGVAAGAMVFEGMEDLFRGFGGHEGHGLGNVGGETVVNNYYGDERESGRAGGEHSVAGADDGSFYSPGQDASREDIGGESRGFADTASDSDDSDSDSGNDFDSDSDDSSDGSSDDGGGDDSNY